MPINKCIKVHPRKDCGLGRARGAPFMQIVMYLNSMELNQNGIKRIYKRESGSN